MGCTQGKYDDNSESKAGRLEKLKMETGYVSKQALAPQRRSTGKRYADRLYSNKPVSGQERPSQPAERPRPRSKNSNTTSFGSSGSGGNGRDKKIGSSSGGDDSGGGNERRRVYRYGEEEVVDGWPKWLIDNVPKEVLAGLIPKSAENYVMIDKVGQGTYSNVYKARERKTGKIVALKKVRFNKSEPQSVKFMAREIMILQKLDHPNVVKLEGIATSRMQHSLYLVFDFMQSDLARIISRPGGRLTEPQVKCYMHQLLSGLQHCHERGILHRDIKGSNLLIDRNGVLKIADFGLANFFIPKSKHPQTSRVVTLWYRAPELLLGAPEYGVGIDLWSAGCLLAEMLAGRPIMPGRTEVEQLHRIFKLCGAPSEDYWKKLKLSTTFRAPKSYQPSLFEAFGEFPESSLGLLSTLLALDPAQRGSAFSALQNEFFYTSPLACDLSGLPAIQQDKGKFTQSDEQRKHQRSRMKQRSRTVRERRNEDFLAIGLKEDTALVKVEEPEQNAVSNIQRYGPGSSTSNMISSSGTKVSGEVESSSFLPSPVASSNSKQNPSPRTPDHPNGIKNIKPKLYNNNSNSAYGLNQIHRSASNREFRKLSQRNALELYSIDD